MRPIRYTQRHHKRALSNEPQKSKGNPEVTSDTDRVTGNLKLLRFVEKYYVWKAP